MVRRSPFLSLLCLLLVVGCASTPEVRRGTTGRPLEGAALPLMSSMGRALEVEGRVGPHRGRVLLDVTRPRTLVSEGCLRNVRVAQEGGRVTIPDARGGAETFEELSLRDLSVGDRRLAPLAVGVRPGDACEVWLGLDVLGSYALAVDPLRRLVRFSAPLSAEAYALVRPDAAEEVGLVRLSREPRTDVPLLPVRLSLETLQFAGTFLLSTTEEQSQLFLPPGALEAASVMGEDEVIAPRVLEVAPELQLTHAPLGLAEQGDGTLMGILGADVWGRFDVVLDLRAGILRLSRPRSSTERCEDASCLEAVVLERSGQRTGSVMLRGRLPEGGVFALRALGAQKETLCELEVSFPMSGSGETLAFPLSGAEAVGGGCAARATTLSPTALRPRDPEDEGGVCVVAMNREAPERCRPGSALGRRPGAAGAVLEAAPEELREPEDPPPLPVRPAPRP